MRIQVADAQDQRLCRLRPPPGHLAAPAPGVRGGAVHRRGREGHPPGRGGRLPAAVLPAGRALAGRAGGTAAALARGSGVRGHRGPGRGGHRLSRPPRCAGLPAPRGALHGGRPADPASAGHHGRHRRPHQRRRHPAQCRGAGLGWRAAVAAGRRPALPAVDQGQHGRGVLLALGPDQRLVRHAGPADRRRFPHRGAEPGARRRRPRSAGGRSPPRPAGGDHGGHRGGRSVTALDRRRDHPGPDPDVTRASTR